MRVQHQPECLVRVMAGGLVDQLAEPAVYQRLIIIRSSSAPRACPHLRPPDSLTSPNHPPRPHPKRHMRGTSIPVIACTAALLNAGQPLAASASPSAVQQVVESEGPRDPDLTLADEPLG